MAVRLYFMLVTKSCLFSWLIHISFNKHINHFEYFCEQKVQQKQEFCFCSCKSCQRGKTFCEMSGDFFDLLLISYCVLFNSQLLPKIGLENFKQVLQKITAERLPKKHDTANRPDFCVSIFILWLLKQMFYKKGLTLNSLHGFTINLVLL